MNINAQLPECIVFDVNGNPQDSGEVLYTRMNGDVGVRHADGTIIEWPRRQVEWVSDMDSPAIARARIVEAA